MTLLEQNGVAVSGAVQGPYNLTATSSNCVSAPSGLTCTFTVNAPIGNDVFAANTYTGLNAGGSALGSGSVALSVLQNATNTASLTLTGPIASVQLFSAGGSTPYLSAIKRTAGGTRAPASLATPTPVTTSRLFIIALDAAGNQIINPTTFDIPVNLNLTLNGLPAGVVQLTVVYAFPTSVASESTTANGGTVVITSPGDQITLSITTSALGTGSAGVGLSYTPQAGPNAGTTVTVAPITYSVTAAPAFTISAPDAAFTAGVAGSIALTVTNTGTLASAGAVTVVDTLPASVTYQSASGAGWSCTSSGYTVTCTNSTSIATNAAAPVLTLNVTPQTSTGSPFSNSFSVSGGGAAATASGSDNLTVANAPSAQFSLGVAYTPTTFVQQTPGTIGISITNTGNAATTVGITANDVLPSGFSYQSASGTGWSCTSSGSSQITVTCTNGAAVAPGTAAPPLYLTVTPSVSGGPYYNNVNVSAGANTTTALSNSVSVTAASTILSIARSHTTPALYLNNFAINDPSGSSFTNTVSNTGNAASAAVTFTDTLPAGMTGTASGTGWSCSGSSTITCTIPSIAANAAAAPITIALTAIGTAGSLTNTTQATATGAVTGTGSDPVTVYGPLGFTLPVTSASGRLQLQLCSPTTACPGTITPTEPNYTGPFFATIPSGGLSGGCPAYIGLLQTQISAGGSFSVYGTQVTGAYNGTASTYCTVTITDGNSFSTSVPVTVTSIGVSGS